MMLNKNNIRILSNLIRVIQVHLLKFALFLKNKIKKYES